MSASSHDWFFDFEMSTPWEPSSEGHFIVPEASRTVIEEDLSSLSGCIGDVTSNHPFPFNSAWPLDWDHGLLLHAFPSIEELQVVGGTARRIAVDYLGFLSWWTASISRSDANLDTQTMASIKAMELHRFHKRGVLIDWEKDWQEINLPNLIQHRIPMAYIWTSSLASTPCFTTLSPHVLRKYNESQLEVGYELHSNDLPDLQNELSVVKRYDHFLQDVTGDGHPDPDVDFNEDWCYYVVDFQGWSRRRIPLRVACEYYVLFSSVISHEDGLTVVLFPCWETLGNPAALTRPMVALEDDLQGCLIRGADEIRELHKYEHTPVSNWHYNTDGRPNSPPKSEAFSPAGRSHANVAGPQDSALFASCRWLCQMASASGRFNSVEVESQRPL